MAEDKGSTKTPEKDKVEGDRAVGTPLSASVPITGAEIRTEPEGSGFLCLGLARRDVVMLGTGSQSDMEDLMKQAVLEARVTSAYVIPIEAAFHESMVDHRVGDTPPLTETERATIDNPSSELNPHRPNKGENRELSVAGQPNRSIGQTIDGKAADDPENREEKSSGKK